MSNTAQSSLQALLRFLTKDASVPLSAAMTRIIPALQRAKLNTPDLIAATDLANLRSVLGETEENTPASSFATEGSDAAPAAPAGSPSAARNKDAEQSSAKAIHNAAKRVTKKRKSDGAGAAPSSSKKRGRATSPSAADASYPAAAGARLEASLALPSAAPDDATEEQLRGVVLVTNRAPLVLAFALQLLKYTMPAQPLSSRLSLAQAMVSLGAAAKARHLGIARQGEEKAPEDEGWGAGQPVVRVMGKDVRVLKRVGYVWREEGEQEESLQAENEEVPLWGLDLEALKRSNAPSAHGAKSHQSTGSLPIYTPQSAHNYIMKAFASANKDAAKKLSAKKEAEDKERNLGLLLAALDLLYKHWSAKIGKDELDRRAWPWYAHVRPDVADGAAGWGGRGEVKLADILDLRR